MRDSHPHAPSWELWPCQGPAGTTEQPSHWVDGNMEVSEPTFLQPAVSQTPDQVLSNISRPIPQSVVPAPPPLPPEQEAPRAGLVHCSSPSRAELILLDLNMRAGKGGLDPPPGGMGRLRCSTALQPHGPFATPPEIIQCWRRPPPSSAASLLLPALCPSPKPTAPLAPCRAPSSPHGVKSSQWTSMGFSDTFQHKPEAGAGGCPGPEAEAPRELRDTCWHMCSFEPRGEKSCTAACGHVSKTIAILTPGPSPESSATGHRQVMCPFQIPALEDRCQVSLPRGLHS